MCFAICLPIVITSVRTVMQIIVSTMKDDLHPHWPPPLPLSAPPPSLLPWLPRFCCHCRRHHCNCNCHCHGCRCLRRQQRRFCCYCYHFLVDCCLPLRCLCFGHRCLPSCLLLLAADVIDTVFAAKSHYPLLLLPQPHDVQNITFKVIC